MCRVDTNRATLAYLGRIEEELIKTATGTIWSPGIEAYGIDLAL